jgi:hypothetical protein
MSSTQYIPRDITGQQFGKLTAIRPVGKNKEGRYLWEFRCECSNVVVRAPHHITPGATSSCGCAPQGRHRIPSAITIIGDGTAEITLSGKHAQGRVAIIDEADVLLVSGYHWMCKPGHQTFYAVARVKRVQVKMHRVIMGLKDPHRHIDHHNRNGLCNRRENLREATPMQNTQNAAKYRGTKSIYKGTSQRASGRWSAYVSFNKIRMWLGTFPTEEAAARAYDAKARELFGEFARCNFPEDHGAPNLIS